MLLRALMLILAMALLQTAEAQQAVKPGPRGQPIRPRLTNALPSGVSTSMVINLPGGVVITNVPPELLPNAITPVRLPTRAARRFEPLGYLPTSFTELARFLIKVPEPGTGSTSTPQAQWEAVRRQIPEEVLAMNGRKVALAGFILPAALENGRVTEFLLLRSQSACCFGMVPRVNELVIVKAPPSGVTPALDTPFVVAGTLSVKWIGEGGQLTAIYEMNAERVERALGR